LNLTHVRNFVAVANAGGLRRAARQLGLAQPAISRSISELERELGTPLFERTTTGMIITPIGKSFLQRALAIQMEIQRAQDEIGQLCGSGAGTVSIGLSTSAHVALLPRALARFNERYPNVVVEIEEGMFPSKEGALRNGNLDFYAGSLWSDKLDKDLKYEKLFDTSRIIVARKGHPMSGARSLSELVDAQWIATSVTTDSQAELEPVFAALKLPTPKFAIKASSGLTMIAAVAFSNALAMLPVQWEKFIASTEHLTRLNIKEPLCGPAMYIVYKSTLPLTPAAQYLADLFHRSALNQPPPSIDMA